jgi:trans-2-enoyl-CoA reductase
VPPRPSAASVVELIEGLAGFTQQFAADGTNSLHGRLMKRLGLRRALVRDEVAEQARAIVPMAASYNAALFRLFLRESGVRS